MTKLGRRYPAMIAFLILGVGMLLSIAITVNRTDRLIRSAERQQKIECERWNGRFSSVAAGLAVLAHDADLNPDVLHPLMESLEPAEC